MRVRCLRTSDTSTIVQFVPEDSAGSIPDFTGEVDQITIRYREEKTLVYCGIGPAKECTASFLRSASARAARAVLKLKRDILACRVPELSLDSHTVEQAIIEGILLGGYQFDKYRSEKNHKLKQLELISGTLTPSQLKKVTTICESVNYARDLVNDNASTVTPAYLVNEAKKLSRSDRCTVTILDSKTLQKKKLNLINAVGGGSATPPALIILEYSGAPRKKQKTAIVGKGVTFDSGGQNLKPTGSIETMREDMAGAAAVLGVISACCRIRPAINVAGVIPAVHNAIGSHTYFPGDIYTSYSGKTVEIWSTDAEGRLILADAIAYSIAAVKPSRIIDCATLTGGVLSALGELVAGLFSNDDDLAEDLFDAGEATGERLWRFPIYKEYRDSLKGDLGDLRNLSRFKKGFASSIIGAAFIQEFVGTLPWAHLDIAGTAFNDGSIRGEVPQFGTGFGVRLLLKYLGVTI